MQERSLPTGLRVNDTSDKKIIKSQYIGSNEIIKFVESLFHISQENVGTIALSCLVTMNILSLLTIFLLFDTFLRIMLCFFVRRFLIIGKLINIAMGLLEIIGDLKELTIDIEKMMYR